MADKLNKEHRILAISTSLLKNAEQSWFATFSAAEKHEFLRYNILRI